MAHEEYTGKSAGTAVTYDSASIPTGWQEITIDEKFKPLAEQIDKTHAGDASWQWMDDPMGGEGSASCTVTIAGRMSVTDHKDSGLLTKTIDGEGDLVVTVGTGGDEFTLADAAYKGMETGAQFGTVQPYTATWTLADSAGVWGTNGA